MLFFFFFSLNMQARPVYARGVIELVAIWVPIVYINFAQCTQRIWIILFGQLMGNL